MLGHNRDLKKEGLNLLPVLCQEIEEGQEQERDTNVASFPFQAEILKQGILDQMRACEILFGGVAVVGRWFHSLDVLSVHHSAGAPCWAWGVPAGEDGAVPQMGRHRVCFTLLLHRLQTQEQVTCQRWVLSCHTSQAMHI